MNKNAVIGLAVVLIGGVAAALFAFKGPDGPAASAPSDAGVAARDPGLIVDEAERVAYVAASVRVTDVKVEPDTKPGSTEIVPGLLRVSGTVSNSGDRKIDKVTLSVMPKDDQGNVLASYQENIAKGVLTPGATRPFQFTIPANSKFAGQFEHKLH